ncbi:MAG: queuosine precursor transporter [Alphaproteobacteria bacterium]|nr:queuosine precursor transporter [Alphaproteobacteria bacterium]
MSNPAPFALRPILLPVVAMILVIAVSNVAVQYPINDWVTWGAFTYPLTFLVTDLTNRAQGPARARLVAYVGFPFGIGLSILISVLWGLDTWSAVRVALASGFAFLCGQLLDITLFNWLRRQSWWRAPLISSVVASVVDTAIFFSAAFAFTGLPWLTWAYGDFGIKVGMALVLLAPFRLLMPYVAPRSYPPLNAAGGPR